MSKKITFGSQEEKDEAVAELKEQIEEKNAFLADCLAELEDAEIKEE